MVVPVTDRSAAAATAVASQLRARGLWVECDDSGRTMHKKIREAQLSQFNFILVVGDAEASNGTVNVRARSGEVVGEMPVAAFADQVLQWVAEKRADK